MFVVIFRAKARALDADLQTWLNDHCGAGTPTYERLKAACSQGVADGWLCQREGSGFATAPWLAFGVGAGLTALGGVDAF